MQTSEINVGIEDSQLLGPNLVLNQKAQQQYRMQQMPRQPPAFQFSIMEHCSRIQQEFQYLERQLTSNKLELQTLKDQKAEYQDHYQRNQNSLIKVGQENHRLTEANARLMKLITSVTNELPPEAQAYVKDQVESVKKLLGETPQAVNLSPVQLAPGLRSSEINLTTRENGDSVPDTKSKKQKVNTSISVANSPFPPRENMAFPLEQQRLISGSPPPLYPVPIKRDVSNSGSEDESNKGKRKGGKSGNSSPNNLTPLSPQSSSQNSGIPRTARMVATLPHNEVVCAITVNGESNHVYTGGKGSVKLWDLSNATNKPVFEMKCLQNSYIRSCKLAAHASTLVVVGETNNIAIWDLAGSNPRMKTNLNSPAQGYAIAVNDEDQSFYACYSDGSIGAWDLKSGKQYKKFTGHSDGVSCIDISPDGQKLITGGLDSTIRVWDINTAKELAAYNFPAQIFSVGICPGESWVAVGLANSHVEVLNLLNSNCKYQLHLHESCVLSLKFANSGKWFITTGKDKLLNSWRSPFGASIFQCREPNSILCSDITSDDRLIVTGSGEQLATVYEVVY